jgi:hypothetical protein
MSYSVDHVYGYGFEISFGGDNFDSKKFFDFLRNHKETIKGLYDGEYIIKFIENENPDIDEFCEEFADRENCEGYGYNTAKNIVADIMNKETGIRFTNQLDMDSDKEFVMLPECMPWLLNEKEKALTEKDLHDICVKYCSEMGLPTEEEHEGQIFGMQKVEYFG